MITLINVWPQIFNFLMKTLEIYSLSNTEIYIQLFLYLACCASDLKKKKSHLFLLRLCTLWLSPNSENTFHKFEEQPKYYRLEHLNLSSAWGQVRLFFCFQTNEQVTPREVKWFSYWEDKEVGCDVYFSLTMLLKPSCAYSSCGSHQNALGPEWGFRFCTYLIRP